MQGSGLLWLPRGLEAAVVLGGVKHSDSLQQPHLRFVTLTLLLLHRLPVGPENAETLLNRRIKANPQFSVIRRKRHVARTERGNRKSTKTRTRIKTPAIHPPLWSDGVPENFGQLPCRISRSSLLFFSADPFYSPNLRRRLMPHGRKNDRSQEETQNYSFLQEHPTRRCRPAKICETFAKNNGSVPLGRLL